MDDHVASIAPSPIKSSNIGFQLLKKHGWKEGTGLGVSEQGRLEPIETHVKKNKRGVGADNKVKKTHKSSSDEKAKRRNKGKGKGVKKMEELEKRLQEKEFERAFFREFWPDNV